MRKTIMAMLLMLMVVFTMAARTTTAYAATDLAALQMEAKEATEANQRYLTSHEHEIIGLPLEISENARALSNEIVGDETDPYKKAQMIYNWMVENCNYGSLPVPNFYEDNYNGVCYTFAKEFQQMCWAQNIPCVYIEGFAIDPNTDERILHAWNIFFANKQWYQVDVTWGNTASNGRNYFGLTTEKMTQYKSGAAIRIITGIWNAEKVNAWAADDVTQAFAYGLIPYSCIDDWNNNYVYTNCVDNCSRKSFAQMAAALLEAHYGKGIDKILEERGVTTGSFTDTDDPAVLAANALGIVNGYGNGTFGPENPITRQEAAAILARTASVLGLPSKAADISMFTDLPQIGEWARDSVAICKELGVMNGTSETTFSPRSPYTREQCIVTIKRLFEAAQA